MLIGSVDMVISGKLKSITVIMGVAVQNVEKG